MEPPATLINEITELFNAGQWDMLVPQARAVTMRYPKQIVGWKALGEALLKSGKWLEAMDVLSQVIKLSPNDTNAHNDLGFAFYNLGMEKEAEASYRHALELNPLFVKSHDKLAALLIEQGRLAEAAVNLQRSLEINPDSYFIQYCLGSLIYSTGGNYNEAITCLERSITLNPYCANSYNILGGVLLSIGQVAKSKAMLRYAQELCPLLTWPAKKEKADFSVVLLYAPGGYGCTPINYLISGAPYDCHFYCVIPDTQPSLDVLQAKADVVINLVADADNGKDVLLVAQALVDCLSRPTFNHPCLIMDTGRETIACRLADISFCRVPRTICFAGSHLLEAAKSMGIDGFILPLLVRITGTHGGDDFEKFADFNAIADFVSKRPEADYYVTEYVDYRSADGFFRKYRWICIDGELLPYHLAIHDDWKVHHFRTDMTNQRWMRLEEEHFLKYPHLVFNESCQAALRAVFAATKLDYCGIDCAFDCNGEILIFEANAAMLVHDEQDNIFTYKTPYIARIKDAFNAKMTRLATDGNRA